MFERVRVAAVVVSLLLAGGVVASSAHAEPVGDQQAAAPSKPARAKRHAVLEASVSQLTEGDRFTLTARVKAPTRAAKVTLEKWMPPLYTGDTGDWLPVKTVRARNKPKATFAAVATDDNTERYRVTVAYKNAKPARSKPVTVTIWRWIPLSEFSPPYYASESYGAGFGTLSINGQAYTGWGAATFSHTGTWESRFTPGRNCTAFRGVLGLGDISKDGSTGTIGFTADDAPIYQSPSLFPGMSVPVTIPLNRPYRLGIQLRDTTPGGTTGKDTVESWPVIGDPALLCTGV